MMSAVSPEDAASASVPRGGTVAALLWDRRLPAYPDTTRRYAYLAIVVLGTIALYYSLYEQYAVSTVVMAKFHMSFPFFVAVSVVGNAVGAFSSLLAGLADRWGRSNLVVYGLLVVGLLMVLALPNAGSPAVYMTVYAIVSFVEGIILVATPALVRDYSPQLGRASAMGYWTMGPVVGSLVVTLVTSNTLTGSTSWQTEFRYAGYGTLIMFVVSFLWLRELTPAVRDQIMVTTRDRALIEARSKEAGRSAESTASLWRQMMRLNVLGSALAISLFLLLYFSAVGNFVVYLATTFGYSAQRANAVLNWYWAANAVSLVVVGVISDRVRVRKPFMIIGALGSIAATSLWAVTATEPDTGYYTFAVLCMVIGIAGGFTYAPWMASFTETVERRNPAATANGLAVWGWIIRAVVALSAAVTPLVVTSVTPLVDHGPAVAAASQQAAPALKIINAHPALFAKLDTYPTGKAPAALQRQAVAEVGLPGLATVKKAGPALAVLKAHGTDVATAQKNNPGEWQTWWWVAVGGQVVFIPFVFVMAGRWSPRKAREDLRAHEDAVAEELRRLGAAES